MKDLEKKDLFEEILSSYNPENLDKNPTDEELFVINNSISCLNGTIKRLLTITENLKQLEYDRNHYQEIAQRGFVESLKITEYLRKILYYTLPKKEYEELPITPDYEEIHISYKNDIVRVQVPHICPRNLIKSKDINPIRNKLRAALEIFYQEFIKKRGEEYKEFVLLEKYIFEESFPKLRDLDRFTSSHLVDELVRVVGHDDNFLYMRKYIRTAKKKGKNRYTILYLTTPENYKKYQDIIEN